MMAGDQSVRPLHRHADLKVLHHDDDQVCSTSSLRIITLISDSSELDESMSKNRSLTLMEELIYKSTHQHRKGRKNSTKSMQIDRKYTHRCGAQFGRFWWLRQ
jgi:hypothetical protein